MESEDIRRKRFTIAVDLDDEVNSDSDLDESGDAHSRTEESKKSRLLRKRPSRSQNKAKRADNGKGKAPANSDDDDDENEPRTYDSSADEYERAKIREKRARARRKRIEKRLKSEDGDDDTKDETEEEDDEDERRPAGETSEESTPKPNSVMLSIAAALREGKPVQHGEVRSGSVVVRIAARELFNFSSERSPNASGVLVTSDPSSSNSGGSGSGSNIQSPSRPVVVELSNVVSSSPRSSSEMQAPAVATNRIKLGANGIIPTACLNPDGTISVVTSPEEPTPVIPVEQQEEGESHDNEEDSDELSTMLILMPPDSESPTEQKYVKRNRFFLLVTMILDVLLLAYMLSRTISLFKDPDNTYYLSRQIAVYFALGTLSNVVGFIAIFTTNLQWLTLFLILKLIDFFIAFFNFNNFLVAIQIGIDLMQLWALTSLRSLLMYSWYTTPRDPTYYEDF